MGQLSTWLLSCDRREHLAVVHRQGEDEIYWVGAPLPRTSAEALTQGKTLPCEQGYPVSNALYGALRQRHQSLGDFFPALKFYYI